MTFTYFKIKIINQISQLGVKCSFFYGTLSMKIQTDEYWRYLFTILTQNIYSHGFSSIGLDENLGVDRPDGDPGEFRTAFKPETNML